MFDRPTSIMPDAAPNGANQRRTTSHCTNGTAACTTSECVSAWKPDSEPGKSDTPDFLHEGARVTRARLFRRARPNGSLRVNLVPLPPLPDRRPPVAGELRGVVGWVVCCSVRHTIDLRAYLNVIAPAAVCAANKARPESTGQRRSDDRVGIPPG
jgi:hypothetical protein